MSCLADIYVISFMYESIFYVQKMLHVVFESLSMIQNVFCDNSNKRKLTFFMSLCFCQRWCTAMSEISLVIFVWQDWKLGKINKDVNKFIRLILFFSMFFWSSFKAIIFHFLRNKGILFDLDILWYKKL